MKKMKSLMLLVATMLMLTVVFCMNASAAEWTKVPFNENAQYTFDEETAVMVIKGEGKLNGNYFSDACPDHYAPEDDVFGCTCSKAFDEAIDPFDTIPPGQGVAVKVKTLIIQEGITSIDVRAFCYFSNLEVAILPQSLTEIPAGAFDGLKKLHTVTLSYSTKSIGEQAFYNCLNLKNIYMPDTLKTIGKKAFYNCNGKNIRIPDSVENADELEKDFFGGKTELFVYRFDGRVGIDTDLSGTLLSTEFYEYNKETKKYTKIAENEKGWIDLEIEPETTRYFVARAYLQTETGRLYYEKSDMVEVKGAPKAPEKVTVKQTDSGVSVSWSKSSRATGYRVYYEEFPIAYWNKAATTTATSCTVTGLKPGKRYFIAVRPYMITKENVEGEGVKDVVVWGDYTSVGITTRPSTVTAKAISPSKGKINLSWNNVSEKIDGYRVYYKVGNGAYKIYKNYSSAQNLTFSNLKSGTKYTFAVRAGIKSYEGIVWSTYKESSVTVK